MQPPRFSAYEYLTFVLPGFVVLSVSVYGWHGWPYGEPGASSLLGILIASFIVGHALSGLSNWVEPLAWWRRPGTKVSSSQGLFGKAGLYDEKEESTIKAAFSKHYSDVSQFESQFRLAYSEALTSPIGPRLQTLVDQIGFYRSMMVASVFSAIIVLVTETRTNENLESFFWSPFFLLLGLTFGYRYRRFWVRLGDYVVRHTLLKE